MSLLAKILLNRFKTAKLASFYILKTAHYDSTSAQILQDCFDDFLGQVLIHEGKATTKERAHEIIKMGHPDFLKITPSDPTKVYLKEDFHHFFSFQNYRAMELTHRFVAVYDSHKISTLLANKLLKTLEEPQEQTSIFFMLPQGHLHLPTIQSRAITLTLRQQENKIPALPGQMSFSDWLDKQEFTPQFKELAKNYFLHQGSIQELLTLLKADRPLQDQICQQLLNWQLHAKSDYMAKEAFLTAIKQYQTAKTFHAPPLERLYCLLETTKRSLQNCQK